MNPVSQFPISGILVLSSLLLLLCLYKVNSFRSLSASPEWWAGEMHAMLSLLLKLAAQHSYNISESPHTAMPFSSSNGGILVVVVEYRMAGNFGRECILADWRFWEQSANGRKFWQGMYFGGLAVLRAIRQYFIHQNFTVCCNQYW